MATLLLSCDDRVFHHQGKYYAASQDKLDFYQRYLRVFERVRLVCRCEEEDQLKDSRIPLDLDSRIEYVPIPSFHGPIQYVKKFISVGMAMKRAVNGCDAAVLRIPSTVALRVGETVKRKRIPYACEVVFDAYDEYCGEHGIHKLLWKNIDKQMRSLCKDAEGISCVTANYLQQHYFSEKPDAFTSNYSSLSLPKSFFGSEKKYPTHKPFVIAHIANQVTFKGRKGHVQIIDAIEQLQQRGIDVKVRFAGKDYFGDQKKLEEYARAKGVGERIQYLGYLNRKSIDDLLEQADLYVMPTMAEGLPRVIIEAMAKGLPCISTPVSGNPELVDEHFLVPYYDTALLADRIEELLSNAAVYEMQSKENFTRSLQYEATLLESRRDKFYQELKKRC